MRSLLECVRCRKLTVWAGRSDEHVALPVIESLFSTSLSQSSGKRIERYVHPPKATPRANKAGRHSVSQSPLEHALSVLNTEDREALYSGRRPAPLSRLIEEVRKQREIEVMERKNDNSDGKAVYVTDSLDDILEQLDRWVSVSSVAIRHETSPVWGGFLFFLTVWFTKTVQLFYYNRG